jgi:hypothetical protein
VPHQQIEIVFGLDRRRHVVVKSQRHAGIGAMLGEARQSPALDLT